VAYSLSGTVVDDSLVPTLGTSERALRSHMTQSQSNESIGNWTMRDEVRHNPRKPHKL
jgi:hypothetical protein